MPAIHPVSASLLPDVGPRVVMVPDQSKPTTPPTWQSPNGLRAQGHGCGYSACASERLYSDCSTSMRNITIASIGWRPAVLFLAASASAPRPRSRHGSSPTAPGPRSPPADRPWPTAPPAACRHRRTRAAPSPPPRRIMPSRPQTHTAPSRAAGVVVALPSDPPLAPGQVYAAIWENGETVAVKAVMRALTEVLSGLDYLIHVQ